MEKNGIKKKITDELLIFWENIIFPYLEKRFGEVDNRLGRVEDRLDKVEDRLGRVEDRLSVVEEKVGNLEMDMKIVKRGIEILQKTTSNRMEFANHEKRISHLENTVFP